MGQNLGSQGLPGAGGAGEERLDAPLSRALPPRPQRFEDQLALLDLREHLLEQPMRFGRHDEVVPRAPDLHLLGEGSEVRQEGADAGLLHVVAGRLRPPRGERSVPGELHDLRDLIA